MSHVRDAELDHRAEGRPPGSIVYVTATLPWPPSSGGHLRTLANLVALSSLVPTHLVAFPFGSGTDAPPIPLASSEVHAIAPSDGIHRMRDRLVATGRGSSPYFERVRRQGGIERLRSALDRTGAHTVILEYPFYPDVAVLLGGGERRFIGDVADDRLALAKATAMHGQWRSRGRALLDVASLSLSESRLGELHQAWFASRDDADAMKRRHPGLAVRTIPNVVDAARLAAVSRPLPEPRSAAFLGSFDYPPNALAANRFVRRIAPRLRQLEPDSRLALIGRSPSRALRGESEAVAVEVLADVPDAMDSLAQYEVMVVPIDVASGTRLKILEAMAAGVAVVSTGAGMAGLDLVHGEHLLRADDDAEIVAAVMRLWRTPELRRSLVVAARKAVLERYSQDSLRHEIRSALGALE